MSYSDDNYTTNSLTYTTTVITGDTDKLLEPGELLEVSLDLTSAKPARNAERDAEQKAPERQAF
jgi:hypothetical protein